MTLSELLTQARDVMAQLEALDTAWDATNGPAPQPQTTDSINADFAINDAKSNLRDFIKYLEGQSNGNP